MRRILHLDMDAFYASVEQRDAPALRGRPVAVGGRPDRRGVVAAASYEARRFGVRSAMPTARAVRLCPELVVVPPDFGRYRETAARIFDMYRSVTPLVEPLSLDEAYLDVTRNSWGEPLATTVARRLKRWMRDEVGLTVSAGAAPNKFLAKIASDWDKPDGLTVIPAERVTPFCGGCRSRRSGASAPSPRNGSGRRASPGSSTCAPPTPGCCGARSGAGPTGCGGSPRAGTTAPSPRTAS